MMQVIEISVEVEASFQYLQPLVVEVFELKADEVGLIVTVYSI